MAMRCALETRCEVGDDVFYFFDRSDDITAEYALKYKALFQKYKGVNVFQIDSDFDQQMLLSSMNFPSYSDDTGVYLTGVWVHYIQDGTLSDEDIQKIAIQEHNAKVEQDLARLD